jgi:hypothetical protein
MRIKLLLLLSVYVGGAFAQSGAGFGSVSGTVVDPSGAAVANAKVTVTNDSRGIKRTLATNEAGLFTAPALPPAAGYSLAVEMPGFAALERKDITVSVGQNVVLPLTLLVAGTATQVEVAGTADIVEDTKSDVSQVVDKTQIDELPINGRRFDSFVLLNPGVTSDGTFGLISFRGMALGNSFLTDGNDTTNGYYQEAPGRTRISSQISQDAVQEFQVITAGYMPEFGRASGGIVNTVTRSGSNDVHGTAFWFFRNRSLNARDRYAAFNPPEVRHQTGASVGGPIKKDKLFYFFNTEITRRHNPIASSITGAVIDQNAQTFIGCGAPATAAQCSAANTIVSRHFTLVDRRADQELLFGKLDWRPTERNSFSVNMNYLRFISPSGIQSGAALTNGAALGSNADSTVRVRYARAAWTSIPSSSIVNEARFGWFKDRQFDSPNGALDPPFGHVTLTIGGVTNLGVSSSYPRLLPSEQRFQFADSLSWTHGRHAMKFGVDVSNTQDVTDSLLNRFGSYTYGNTTVAGATVNAVTNFALDYTGSTVGGKRWQTYTQTFGNSRTDVTLRDWSFFAQDQYRVTKNLTVNYGIRYDYTQIPQPSVVNPDYPQTGRIPSYSGQVGPRFGLAYGFNNSRTVFRAGYGLFHSRYGGGVINTMFTANGVYQKSVSYTGSLAADNAAGPSFPNRLPASDKPPSGTVNIAFAAPDFRPNYTQNGDLSIEHQLRRNTTLTVSYLYNRGFHIIGTRDLNVGPLGAPVTYSIRDAAGNTVGAYTTPIYLTANRVDPRYQRVFQIEHGGKAWYDGLATQLRGRFSSDLLYWVSYTWSHAIDLGQGQGDDSINRFAGNTSLNNLFNGDYRADKGDGQLDQRHRLVFTFIAKHDFTKRTDAVSKYVINNWQVSGVTTLSSGRPTFATINIATKLAQIPFFTLNGFGGDTRVPFLPTNAARLDGVYKLDARLTKNLPITERYKLTLNFEAFNVTNTPYDTSIGSGSSHNAYSASNLILTPVAGYGVGTQSAGFPDGTNVRRAQVSLRFVF